MLAITGWMSLALLGVGPATGEPPGQVSVQVRLMEMKGVSWRGAAFHELTPQGRQGAAAVWTASPEGGKILFAQTGTVIQSRRVDANEGSTAQVRNETLHNYVGHLKRVADGPPGRNTKVAYVPEIETVPDGISAEFSCRTVEGGTLVRATVDDVDLIGFDNFSVPDSVTDPKTKKKTAVNTAQVQIPRLTTSHVTGEWIVPRGGVLVVGFGPKSTASSKKGSDVRERVVLIEPTPLKIEDAEVHAARYTPPKPIAAKPVPAAPGAVSPALLPLLASPTVGPRIGWKASVRIEARATPPVASDDDAVTMMCLPLSAAPFPLSQVWMNVTVEPRRAAADGPKMATPPSRGLPTPIDGDGQVVELPPLPDLTIQRASTDSSADARPSPQSHPVVAAPMAARTLRTLDDRLRRVLNQFVADRQATLNQLVCDEVIIEPVPTFDIPVFPPLTFSPDDCPPESLDAAIESAFRSGQIQWGCVFPSGERGGVVQGSRASRPRVTSADDPKADDAYVQAYYGQVLRVFDGNPVENIGRPINIEIPAASAKTIRGATLGLQLKSADGGCEYDSGISLKAIEAQPVTIRVPMADGTIVEIQAKVVKPAKK